MTKDEALDLALEALEGMTADLGKFESDVPAITAIKQARALDKKAENARELGLDYEPVLKDNSNYRYDPPVAEPVAWAHKEGLEKINDFDASIYARGGFDDAVPLYINPPAQPAPVQPVALDVTLDGEEAKLLRDMLGDDRDEPSPVRLLVGNGHSGHGLYAAQAEYQEEGAVLLATTTPPAAHRQWVGLETNEVAECWHNDPYKFYRAIEAKLKEKNA
jgi:hypothetical protein